MSEPTDPLPSPAEFLRRQLEQRGLSQADLAFVLGVPQQAVNQLALGKRSVSADMAKALAQIFGVSAEYILQLQKAHEVPAELSRARTPDPGIARKAWLLATFPVRDMIKRGWLDKDPATIEAQLARFFNVTSLDQIPQLAHAAKKTDYGGTSALQLAWVHRVRQIASGLHVTPYSERRLREALDKLRALLSAPEEARHAPRILAEAGVRFVLVESLPGAKIDGVTLWIDGSSPVIGMSIRFDRIDNFWFVLRHEIEHVLQRDGVETPMIDDLEGEKAGTGAGLPPEEQRANAAASEFCVPKDQMDSWVARKHPFYSETDLIGFSRRICTHPGIVAGQLRNRTQNFRIFAKHLEKIRFAVASAAVVDGWGQIDPTLP